MYRHIWAEIDLDALQHNITQISNIVSKEQIMAVVKANAYGHGAGEVCRLLEKNGINNFAVSNVYEALDLRQKIKAANILILGNTDPAAAKELAQNNITACVFSNENAEKLNAAAKENGITLNCHIKLDSGMGRIGFNCQNEAQLEKSIRRVFELSNLCVTGAFTHYATADRDGDETADFVNTQYERFLSASEKVLNIAKEYGKGEIKIHSANSAATLLDSAHHPSHYYRAGIILYGLTPAVGLQLPCELKPVMSLKATVAQVKTIKAGDTISYGRTFTAKGEMRVATVTAGYADGYSRALSNKGYMLIRGKKAPIIGRVCMDQTVVDVTGIEDASYGDTATLFGEGLPVDNIAAVIGTINYEIVCDVAHRVPRIYIKNAKIVNEVRYLSV